VSVMPAKTLRAEAIHEQVEDWVSSSDPQKLEESVQKWVGLAAGKKISAEKEKESEKSSKP
jgi:hypothetical protein